MWEKYKERNEKIRQMKGLDTKINEKRCRKEKIFNVTATVSK